MTDFDSLRFKDYMRLRLDWFNYCQRASDEAEIIPYAINQPCQYLDPSMQRCLLIAESNSSLFERVFSIFITLLVKDEKVLDSAASSNKTFKLIDIPKLYQELDGVVRKRQLLEQDFLTCLYHSSDGRIRIDSITSDNLYTYCEVFMRRVPPKLWKYGTVRDTYYSLANLSDFNFMTNRDLFCFSRALAYLRELMIEDRLCDYRPQGYFKALAEFGDNSSSKLHNHEQTIDRIIDYYQSLDHKTIYTRNFYPNDVLALIDGWTRLVLRPKRTTKKVDPQTLVGQQFYKKAWYDYKGNETLLLEVD